MIYLHKMIRAAKVGLIPGAALGAFAFTLPLWAQSRAQRPPVRVPAKPMVAAPQAGDKPDADGKETADDSNITLAGALEKARLGRGGLALAVNADAETLTKKEASEKKVDTVSRAVLAFNRSSRDFGGVTAIGPDTYTELNTDFSRGNAFSDMPPTQAFTLLLSTLDDGQRAALTGKTGLGISDLTTPTQKQLFEALLPDGEVNLSRRGESEDAPDKGVGNLREKASAAHFRVAQEVSIQVEAKAQDYGRLDVPTPPKPGDPPVYDLSSYAYNNQEKVNGVVIRREVPNHLKTADLNYNAPALQVLIPIKDLKTVGDLTARIAKQTRIELYCDPNYEKQALTWVVGGKTSASASEMLRALAFCVAGTYRRVGAAFVLTEDLIGVGTRRQMIQDFEEACDAERQIAVQAAQKKLMESPAQKNLKLSGFNDPLAMTPEQEKASSLAATDSDIKAKVIDMIDSMSSLGGASLPYDKLTLPQQQAVQAYEKAQQESKANNPTDGLEPEASQPDFDKNYHILKKLSIQMVITGLNGVVATDFGAELMPLFKPEFKMPEASADDLKEYQNLPKWKDAAKTYKRRAVICKPHTTADVDASLLRISTLGFNQMWLVVFQDGKARIPGTPFPLDPAFDPKVDLLTYAIAEGKKKGITVCPVVSVLAWGSDAPKEARLLTLRGENSAQSALRRSKVNGLQPTSIYSQFMPKVKVAAPAPNLWVDPTQPTTQAALSGLFQALAAHVGVGEFVCRDMTPTGFSGLDINFNNPMFPKQYDSMGYNEGLRLAFLKKNHCDPIDIARPSASIAIDSALGGGSQNRADMTLTNYEANNGSQAAQKWAQFKADSLNTSLHSLFNPVLKSSGDKKFGFMAQSSLSDFLTWFDIINDPAASFVSDNLFGVTLPATDGKPAPAPPFSILFLAKESPYALPKEVANVDYRDMEMKILESFKEMRKWDGVAIEE